MREQARLRDELRSHGVVSASCKPCYLLGVCGGIEPERALLNCFDIACCGTGTCDRVCPFKKGDYIERLREVRGLRFNDLRPISQLSVNLPRYVPVVYHRSKRYGHFDYPAVALDTYRVVRLKRGKYRTIASDPVALRSAFGVAPGARVILRGTARDPFLERYWQYGERDEAAQQLAALGVALIIPPNFSHFLRVPRTDNLFNRKRQLICIEEMNEAGLTVAPHLSAVTPGDWDFWQGYLRDNPSIRYVSKEFQTGNKSRSQGRRAIDAIALLQDALGRSLHPVMLGGSQFTEYAATRFCDFTLIDAEPFVKTCHRRRFDLKAGRRPWRESYTLIDQGLDQNFDANVADYARWIEMRSSFEQRRPTTAQGDLFLRPPLSAPALARAI